MMEEINKLKISFIVLFFPLNYTFPEKDDALSLCLQLNKELHDFFVEVDTKLISPNDNLPVSLVLCFQNGLKFLGKKINTYRLLSVCSTVINNLPDLI